MTIERDSVHYLILERLCSLPRPVRGTSGAMLQRDYDAPGAVAELAAAGLIRERGWHDGPGSIWVPTADGEALYQQLAAAGPVKPASPRWITKPELKSPGG
jgi:hypothetical protein